jgi:hypothetical protein
MLAHYTFACMARKLPHPSRALLGVSGLLPASHTCALRPDGSLRTLPTKCSELGGGGGAGEMMKTSGNLSHTFPGTH